MDYFALFGIPVSLKPSRADLRKRYVELSKQHHPDYFVNNDTTEQEHALEMSALLNKAFKTLNDGDETIRYVLMNKGLLEEEEKYTLPPAFLMEMMEVNEALADAEMNDDGDQKAVIRRQLEDLEKELYEPVQSIIENYKEGVTANEALLQVKDYYFKKKYLHRLSSQLNRMS